VNRLRGIPSRGGTWIFTSIFVRRT